MKSESPAPSEARRKRWPMPYSRPTAFNREFMFGLDSVQGCLEMAEVYPNGAWLCAGKDSIDDVHSLYGALKQLEEDGYLKSQWVPLPGGDGECLRLEKIWLTTKGRELLYTLKERSKPARWRKRCVDLLWTIGTSAATTLVTLHIKS